MQVISRVANRLQKFAGNVAHQQVLNKKLKPYPELCKWRSFDLICFSLNARGMFMFRMIVKNISRLLFGDYAAYYVYMIDAAISPISGTSSNLEVRRIDEATVRLHQQPFARNLTGWCGPGFFTFGCFQGPHLAGLCFYSFGSHNPQRDFWPLQENQATLVEMLTRPDMRNQGVAKALINHSCRSMMEAGFHTVYARVWHSNVPSWRAFERSGWRRIALVVEINPFRRKVPFRLQFRK